MSNCVKEFEEYICSFLEQAHTETNGFPVCPFARKSRLANKIRFVEYTFSPNDLTDPAQINMQIDEFSKSEREILLFIHPNKNIDLEMISAIAAMLRAQHEPALMVFHGHPDDPFTINGLRTRNEPYPNVLVQKQEILDEARKMLKNTDYYKGWTKEMLDAVGASI